MGVPRVDTPTSIAQIGSFDRLRQAGDVLPGLSQPRNSPSQADGRARFDYTAVGHVTVDVMADGSRRAGGSALYSGLQAARLGQRVLIITRGEVREIEHLLEPYRGELEVEILQSSSTTTLESFSEGAERRQRVLAWAGPIGQDIAIDTSILHLAPVVRETPRRWRGRADFVGLTAQGLIRAWEGPGGEISHAPLERSQLPQHCDAIVISRSELESCACLLSGAARSAWPGVLPEGGDDDGRGHALGGTVVAITAAAAPTTVQLDNGALAGVEVPAVENFRDDVGAGDVFAAAFFVAMREGRPAASAARFANAAAAVRIAGVDAGGIGDRPAIDARLRAVA